MGTWSSGDVMVNGARISYHRSGGERPPLVLLHGFSDCGLCWSRVARVLQEGYDVVMPDARGHGDSERAGSAFDRAESPRDVAGLIEALGLDRPAVGGHSMGAMTAAQLAAERPQLVSCLILEDPPWRDRPGAGPARWDHVVRSQEMAEAEVAPYCRQLHPTWDEAEIGPWVAAKRSFDLALLDAPRSPLSWRSVAAGIGCPVLLLTGDVELGALVTPEVAAEASAAGGRRTEHIGGAGHNIRRERYEPYMRAVRSFLDEVYPPGPAAPRAR